MAVNPRTSFLTPPFGFALFRMNFVLPQLCGLGLGMTFPQIALWLPGKPLH